MIALSTRTPIHPETPSAAVALGRVALAGLALAALAGCTALPSAPSAPADAAAAACEARFARIDAAVAAAGVGDAEATRIPGFPTLRVDRFLASFRDELAAADWQRWTDALRRLDHAARTAEVARLPAPARERLRADLDALSACADTLHARDLADVARRSALRAAAAVPDDYSTGLRIAGLYWLTRLPFALGVDRYQAGVQASFDTPPAALPVLGRLVRYAPAAAAPAGAWAGAVAGTVAGAGTEAGTVTGTVTGAGTDAATGASSAAALRVREAGARFEPPDPADAAALLAAHAPVFVVDEALPADRIGSVRLDASGAAVVATDAATVYGRVAFTRFDGRVLAQAVYTAWFPARPKTGPLDLLGGEFDAVVWRVTLDADGTPLVYDSMHACGCYHMFFPTSRVRLRPRPWSLDEWALVPQTLPASAAGPAGAPLRLRLASRTHYLVRVETDADGVDEGHAAKRDRRYALRPAADLRSLAGADGRRGSLYGPDGLVPGSERGERWLFWPMGVREPGAMRQWGRHATAFIGRRHFDDAHLLDRYFTRR